MMKCIMIISILILAILIFAACLLIAILYKIKDLPEKLLFIDAQTETSMESLAEIGLGIKILLLKKYNINLSEAYKTYKDKVSEQLEKEFNDEDL